MNRLRSPSGRAKTLPAVQPNQGLEAVYRRKLERLIAEMHASLTYWLKAAYRARPPEMAADAPDGFYGGSPAMRLREEMAALGKRWQARFDAAAPELAKYFATAA